MKRSECTAEKLKELGYVGKSNFVNAWRFGSNDIKDLDKKQSNEVFKAIVDAVRCRQSVEISKNNALHTVCVTLPQMQGEYRGTKIYYYLERPMNEAEIFEANTHTGQWGK
jgi:hypothetical protein